MEKLRFSLISLGEPGSGKTSVLNCLLSSVEGNSPRGPRAISNPTQHLSFFLLETRPFSITLIDSPGSNKYIKNIIAGTSQADFGLFVISADLQELPSEIKNQTLAAFTMGIKHVIVAVNKMDKPAVNWTQECYEKVRAEVGNYLQRVGYRRQATVFVPISCLFNENIITPSACMPWYEGPNLLQALETLTPPRKLIDKPLRLSIVKHFKVRGVGTVAAGRVLTGDLNTNTVISIDGKRICIECRSIQRFSQPVDKAITGDFISFHAKTVSMNDLRRGMVISESTNYPALEVESFEAQLIYLDDSSILVAGCTYSLHVHTARVPCKVTEVFRLLDRRTGRVMMSPPDYVLKDECAMVSIVPLKPVCLEQYYICPLLGRFILTKSNVIIAVGVVKSVVKIPNS